ncbi:MAG: hypothetical protein JWM98_1429 [Thermoleophilia bacterium]|nr:hypothetical protein [Thermoleophilia bacterium]
MRPHPRRLRRLRATGIALALLASVVAAPAAHANVSPDRAGAVVGCGPGVNGIPLFSTSGMQWSMYGWIPLNLNRVAVAPRIAVYSLPAPGRWRPTGFNAVYVWGQWFFANTGDQCASGAPTALPPGGPGFRFGR